VSNLTTGAWWKILVWHRAIGTVSRDRRRAAATRAVVGSFFVLGCSASREPSRGLSSIRGSLRPSFCDADRDRAGISMAQESRNVRAGSRQWLTMEILLGTKVLQVVLS